MVEGTLRLAPLFLIERFVPEQHQDDKAFYFPDSETARENGALRDTQPPI